MWGDTTLPGRDFGNDYGQVGGRRKRSLSADRDYRGKNTSAMVVRQKNG